MKEKMGERERKGVVAEVGSLNDRINQSIEKIHYYHHHHQ